MKSTKKSREVEEADGIYIFDEKEEDKKEERARASTDNESSSSSSRRRKRTIGQHDMQLFGAVLRVCVCVCMYICM